MPYPEKYISTGRAIALTKTFIILPDALHPAPTVILNCSVVFLTKFCCIKKYVSMYSILMLSIMDSRHPTNEARTSER